MSTVWIITSALQRIEDVRTPGERKYRGRTDFLSNIERRVQVATPKAREKGALTNWGAQKES